jgi:hypothetical protein
MKSTKLLLTVLTAVGTSHAIDQQQVEQVHTKHVNASNALQTGHGSRNRSIRRTV